MCNNNNNNNNSNDDITSDRYRSFFFRFFSFFFLFLRLHLFASRREVITNINADEQEALSLSLSLSLSRFIDPRARPIVYRPLPVVREPQRGGGALHRHPLPKNIKKRKKRNQIKKKKKEGRTRSTHPLQRLLFTCFDFITTALHTFAAVLGFLKFHCI